MKKTLLLGMMAISFCANAGIIETSYQKQSKTHGIPPQSFVMLVSSQLLNYPKEQRLSHVDEVVKYFLDHEQTLRGGILKLCSELEEIKRSPEFKRASLMRAPSRDQLD